MNKLKQIPEFLRFVMVGLLLQGCTMAFILSCKIHSGQCSLYLGICAEFCCQLLSYGLFYFRAASFLEESFWLRGAHLTNYLIHIGLLNLFLRLGFSRPLAPIPVFLIAIPVNFLLVRFVFKQK